MWLLTSLKACWGRSLNNFNIARALMSSQSPASRPKRKYLHGKSLFS